MSEKCPGCGLSSWKVPEENQLHLIEGQCFLCGAPIYGEVGEPPPAPSFWTIVMGTVFGTGSLGYRLRLAREMIKARHG